MVYFGMVLGVDTAGFKLLSKDLSFMVRWKFSPKAGCSTMCKQTFKTRQSMRMFPCTNLMCIAIGKVTICSLSIEEKRNVKSVFQIHQNELKAILLVYLTWTFLSLLELHNKLSLSHDPLFITSCLCFYMIKRRKHRGMSTSCSNTAHHRTT